MCPNQGSNPKPWHTKVMLPNELSYPARARLSIFQPTFSAVLRSTLLGLDEAAVSLLQLLMQIVKAVLGLMKPGWVPYPLPAESGLCWYHTAWKGDAVQDVG